METQQRTQFTGLKLTIKGRLPALNDYTQASRGKDWYKSAKMKKEAENLIIWCINTQLPKVIKTPIYLTFKWYERDRARDKDNIAFAKKFILDALQKSKRIKNDGWNEISGFNDEFYVDKKNPRIEVEIKDGTRLYQIVSSNDEMGVVHRHTD